MSYCRFIEADVYVYASDRGYECCGCTLHELGSGVAFPTFPKAEDMAAHLREHIERGDYIPNDVIPEILADGDIVPP